MCVRLYRIFIRAHRGYESDGYRQTRMTKVAQFTRQTFTITLVIRLTIFLCHIEVYSFSDFDCILTNLNLERLDKGKFKLPAKEKDRTDSILKRALAVEKGDAKPTLTAEHPDGCKFYLLRSSLQFNKFYICF